MATDIIARGLATNAGSVDNFISNVDTTQSSVTVSKSSDGKLILTGSGAGLGIVIAWNGESEPVVSNIPEDVEVDYDGSTYIGTLVASGSTTQKIYFVYNSGDMPNVYKEYMTIQEGSLYYWELIGTTEIDLTDYVKNTNYATNSVGGVVKVNDVYDLNIASDGTLSAIPLTYQNYVNKSSYSFISKGTLENVITGKNLKNPLLIQSESNTTVNGYQVPSLTIEQITQAYNGFVDGQLVIILDANGIMHFLVEQADTDGSDFIISFDYYDVMQLTYDSNGDINFITIPKVLKFENVRVDTTDWVEDTTYSGFEFKADINCTGVTTNYFPEVVFAISDATSGNFAPISLSGNGIVTIYAVKVPETAITISTINCIKG